MRLRNHACLATLALCTVVDASPESQVATDISQPMSMSPGNVAQQDSAGLGDEISKDWQLMTVEVYKSWGLVFVVAAICGALLGHLLALFAKRKVAIRGLKAITAISTLFSLAAGVMVAVVTYQSMGAMNVDHTNNVVTQLQLDFAKTFLNSYPLWVFGEDMNWEFAVQNVFDREVQLTEFSGPVYVVRQTDKLLCFSLHLDNPVTLPPKSVSSRDVKIPLRVVILGGSNLMGAAVVALASGRGITSVELDLTITGIAGGWDINVDLLDVLPLDLNQMPAFPSWPLLLRGGRGSRTIALSLQSGLQTMHTESPLELMFQTKQASGALPWAILALRIFLCVWLACLCSISCFDVVRRCCEVGAAIDQKQVEMRAVFDEPPTPSAQSPRITAKRQRYPHTVNAA